MGWRDRPYARGTYGYGRSRYHGPGLSGLSVTTSLIIANVVVHLLVSAGDPRLARVILSFGVMQADAVLHGQLWRLFTATYLHAGFNHIFFNMLGLYFFGPALERVWGPRQFLLAYSAGDIAGNILLTLAGLLGFIGRQAPGLGASGSVLTLLGAAAVLFPHAQVYVYFLFPIRIRTFVALYGLWFLYNVARQGANFGGDLCHLGGLAVGLWWGYSGGLSLSGRHRTRIDPSSLLGRLAARAAGKPRPRAGQFPSWQARPPSADEQEVDRILKKVHDQGLDSLTAEERDTLAEASRRRR